MTTAGASLSKYTVAVISFVLGAFTFMCISQLSYPKEKIFGTPNYGSQNTKECLPSLQMSVPLRGGNSSIDCRGRKQTLITNIYSRDEKLWQKNTNICKQCFNFPRGNLKTPKGTTPIFVYKVKNDIWVSKALLNTGGFESQKFNVLFKMLQDDPQLNVVDIGSNVGVFSLSVAKMGRFVLAVEALNVNLQHVCASVMEGGLQDRVVLVHNAISNDHAVVNLGIDKNNMGGTYVDVDSGHIKELKAGRAQGTYGQVQTITMNDLLDLPVIGNFPKVIIKMDIEGFEAKAVEKGREFFKQIKVVAFLMEWVFHANQQSGKDIIRYMTELNYAPYSMGKQPLDINRSGSWGTDVLWLPK